MSRVKLILLSLLAVVALSAVASASASAHVYEFYTCKEVAEGKFETKAKCEKSEPGKGKWEWTPIVEPLKVEGTSGVSLLEGELASIRTELKCKKDKVSGELEKEGKDKGEITFEECKLYEVEVGEKGEHKHNSHETLEICSAENIKFSFTSKLVRGEALGPENWGPEIEFTGTLPSEVYVEIKLSSTCPGLLSGAVEKVKQHEVEIAEGCQKVTAGTGIFEEAKCEKFGGVREYERTARVRYKGQVCSLPEAAEAMVEHEIICTSKGSHLTFGGGPGYFFSTDKLHATTNQQFFAE
jgi:hypothetical protein